MNRPIKHVAIIGTGVIGASWAALDLAKGLKVAATDPAPDAENATPRTRAKSSAALRWPASSRVICSNRA